MLRSIAGLILLLFFGFFALVLFIISDGEGKRRFFRPRRKAMSLGAPVHAEQS